MSPGRSAVHCQNVHSVAVDGNLDRAVQRRVENCSETVTSTLKLHKIGQLFMQSVVIKKYLAIFFNLQHVNPIFSN